MINKIIKLFHLKKKKTEIIETSRFAKFAKGTKVKLSQKALNEFPERSREFYSKHVYEVVDYDISLWEGTALKLNCGTFLWADQAIEVDKDTPLFH